MRLITLPTLTKEAIGRFGHRVWGWLVIGFSLLLVVAISYFSCFAVRAEPIALAAISLNSVGLINPQGLNSTYTDEHPVLSGSGRFLAFISGRDGRRRLMLYDLQLEQLVDLPWLNRRDAIAEHPSISNNARYIVYVASDSGRPEVELYDRVTQLVQVLTGAYRGWFRNPSISPDGRYIAFESGREGQWDIQMIDRGSNIELDILDQRS